MEIRSALCRLRHDDALDADALQRLVLSFDRLFEGVHAVALADPVRARAK